MNLGRLLNDAPRALGTAKNRAASGIGMAGPMLTSTRRNGIARYLNPNSPQNARHAVDGIKAGRPLPRRPQPRLDTGSLPKARGSSRPTRSPGRSPRDMGRATEGGRRGRGHMAWNDGAPHTPLALDPGSVRVIPQPGGGPSMSHARPHSQGSPIGALNPGPRALGPGPPPPTARPHGPVRSTALVPVSHGSLVSRRALAEHGTKTANKISKWKIGAGIGAASIGLGVANGVSKRSSGVDKTGYSESRGIRMY